MGKAWRTAVQLFRRCQVSGTCENPSCPAPPVPPTAPLPQSCDVLGQRGGRCRGTVGTGNLLQARGAQLQGRRISTWPFLIKCPSQDPLLWHGFVRPASGKSPGALGTLLPRTGGEVMVPKPSVQRLTYVPPCLLHAGRNRVSGRPGPRHVRRPGPAVRIHRPPGDHAPQRGRWASGPRGAAGLPGVLVRCVNPFLTNG